MHDLDGRSLVQRFLLILSRPLLFWDAQHAPGTHCVSDTFLLRFQHLRLVAMFFSFFTEFLESQAIYGAL
jgi:hypothetical protein